MKEQIEFFLEQDPHADSALVIGRQRPQSPKVVRLLPGWDLTGYAANDLSIFRLTETYMAVNADSSFLNDKIAEQATGWPTMGKLPICWNACPLTSIGYRRSMRPRFG
jgi:hypothetical protein